MFKLCKISVKCCDNKYLYNAFCGTLINKPLKLLNYYSYALLNTLKISHKENINFFKS